LPSGVVIDVGGASGTAFYPADLTTPTYPADAIGLQQGIAFDSSGNIYSSDAIGFGGMEIRKLTSAGVNVTTYTLDDWDQIYTVSVNAAGTRIYLTVLNTFNADPAKRKNLKQIWVYDTTGPTYTQFVSDPTYSTSYNTHYVVPATGDLIVAWRGTGLNGRVDRFSSSGVLLQMYTPVYNGMGVRPFVITPGLTDATFWMMAGANNTYGTVAMEVDIASGTVRNSFDPPDDGTFDFLAPFCVLRAPVPYAYP
jgi:hypothetical protein